MVQCIYFRQKSNTKSFHDKRLNGIGPQTILLLHSQTGSGISQESNLNCQHFGTVNNVVAIYLSNEV